MTALTVSPGSPIALLMDPQAFDHLQRVGTMLAMSPLFPDHLRKGDKHQATANAVLVLNMAHRLNEDPLTVAQNIYFVGGKPGWSSAYMISKANMHGVFKNPIDWEVTGRGTDNLSVTAFAVLAGTGKRVQVTCDMALAKAEGWTKNPKYNSMPEQMLRYRSAAFLIRLYCPEVMIGVPAAVEVEMEAMRDVTPADVVEAAPDDEPKAEAKRPDTEPATVKENLTPQTEAKEEPKAASDAIAAEAARVVKEREAKAQPAKNAPDRFAFDALFNTIVNDLLEAPADDVRSLYADQIEAMAAAFPDMADRLEEEFKAAGG